MMLAINAERLLFKHGFKIPEEWFSTQLTGIRFNPVGSSFSHAIDLKKYLI
jgi:hypothetical protein